MPDPVRRAARVLFVAGCAPVALMPFFHLVGFWQGKQSPPAELQSVLSAMEASRFDLMGSSRSMMNLYDGFNLSFAALLAMVAMLALLASRHAATVRAFRVVAGVMIVGQLGLAAIAARTMAAPLVILFVLGAAASVAALVVAPHGAAQTVRE
jgi:hypothetical protein